MFASLSTKNDTLNSNPSTMNFDSFWDVTSHLFVDPTIVSSSSTKKLKLVESPATITIFEKPDMDLNLSESISDLTDNQSSATPIKQSNQCNLKIKQPLKFTILPILDRHLIYHFMKNYV